jgi:tripartite-type tricarboxylate transporter receptor subunit TctC
MFALAGGQLAASAANAQSDVAEFFQGRQISIAVVAAGGGYGTNGQLLAEHMGRHIPGNPTVVTMVRSGAGGRTLMNWLYNVAPKDGTAVGFLHKDIAAFSLIEGTGAHYKADGFQWIGSVAPMNTVMFVWHTAPATTIEALRETSVVMGASGKSHPTALFPTLINNLSGTKFKVVTGYRGSNDIFLAIEQGEVGGTTFTWDTVQSQRSQWIRDKQIVPIVHVSLDKEPDLPHVPLLADIMTSEADKAVAEFLASGSRVGRAFGAPPGVPAERIAALRAAFDAVTKDPAYLAAAKKANLPVQPLPGAEVQKLVEKHANAPQELVERAKKALGIE